MAKGDFKVEEPDYYVNDDNEKDSSIKQEQTEPKQEKPVDIYHQDYSENSDFSHIGVNKDMDYIDSSNIVFEDKQDQTPEEKVKYYLSTINKRMVIVIAGILFLILVILLLITAYISKNRASYFSEIIAPEVVYMGETGNISVMAKGKKDLDQTTTTFESKNPDVVTILDKELKGKDVLNTIIPIQEGRAKIEINSKLNKKNMAKETREIVVCPAFNNDLLLTENISVVKESMYDLTTDFGEKECSKGIKYESSNEEIMKVDSNGRIEGVNVGKAILTLRKEARSISVNVEVTKAHVYMKTFSVTPTKVQLKPKQNVRLKVGYTPANATTSPMNFQSSDEEIVTVSEGGLIKALKPGIVTITAKPISSILSQNIQVIVSEEQSDEGTVVTEMTLDKTDITVIQGESEKVLATLTPDNAKNKKIIWESSDNNIATVTEQGVIYAKKPGTVTITASANNDVSRTVKVTVVKMKNPIIKASDEIETNQWHNKPYTLKFSGSENGVAYYYGKTEKDMNNKGTKVTVTKDEKATYYVKACKNGVCSNVVQYISKLDTTKPKVLTVAGIDTSATKVDSVQIPMRDTMSLIHQWCVAPVDSSTTCKWKTITGATNPVVTYTATYNSAYYAFAKDTAGNISDSYKFEITNIE